MTIDKRDSYYRKINAAIATIHYHYIWMFSDLPSYQNKTIGKM